jgi:hypothetical protein
MRLAAQSTNLEIGNFQKMKKICSLAIKTALYPALYKTDDATGII